MAASTTASAGLPEAFDGVVIAALILLPEGATAEALMQAPALTFSDKDRLQEQWVDRQIGGRAKRAAFPSHRLASSQGFVDACLAGLGWGLNPEALVAGHIAAGRLVDLSSEAPLDVPLHWQFARLTAPAIRPLTDALRDAAAAQLHEQLVACIDGFGPYESAPKKAYVSPHPEPAKPLLTAAAVEVGKKRIIKKPARDEAPF